MEPIKNVFSLKPNKRDIIEGFILGIKIFHQFFFQKISVVVPFALIHAFLVQTCFFFLIAHKFYSSLYCLFFLHCFTHWDYDSTGSYNEDGRHQTAKLILLGYKKQEACKLSGGISVL